MKIKIANDKRVNLTRSGVAFIIGLESSRKARNTKRARDENMQAVKHKFAKATQ